MTKKLNRFARRVAAIDEKSIQASTKSDKIWATQIGYMLMLTFAVLFSITYFSVDYFNGSKITFDQQTNMMQMVTGEKNPWLIAGGVAIAAVIASIIFMFDRAVFQSDWFVQTPYGIPQSWGAKIWNAIVKTFRILVRLSISVAIAYALSTFLELRMYSAQIEEVMQYDNMRKNASIYDEIKQYAIKTDKQIKEKNKEKNELEKRLDVLRSGEAPWVLDKGIERMKERHNQEQRSNTQALERIKSLSSSEAAPIKQELSELIKQREKLLKEIELTEMKQKAEEYGLSSIQVANIQMQTSGKRGDGARSKILKKRIKQLKNRKAELDTKVQGKRRELHRIIETYRKREAEINKIYLNSEKDFSRKIKSYESATKAKYEKYINEKISDATKRLQEVSAELDKLTSQKETKIKHHTQSMLHSPHFIPFRDGPIVRISALHKLSSQGEHAEEISRFSYVVKAFLIFLEVVPVVAKMFFSPPSVYAAMLQSQVKNRVKHIIQEGGITISELDEQIGVEKKRIKLNHLRNRRKISDELNHQAMREHLQRKYSFDSTDSEAA